MNNILGENNKSTSDYLQEIKTLRQVTPICSFCKKIKDTNENWINIESYISENSSTDLTHTYCSACSKEHFGDIL